MGWLDAVISGAFQATGQLGGAAIEGGFKSQQARIGADAGTSQTFMQQMAAMGLGGWDAITASVGNNGQGIANQYGIKTQSQTAIEIAKIEAESQKKQTMLLALLGGVALVVIAIVLLNKK